LVDEEIIKVRSILVECIPFHSFKGQVQINKGLGYNNGMHFLSYL